MESAHSIRFLYQHFLAGITEKSLNTFYHACSYAKADYSRFMNVTAKIALHLIPEQLKSQPVFLCIDDPLSKSIQTLISLEMLEQILLFMILPLHQQEGNADQQNTENVYQQMMISLSDEKINGYYIGVRRVLTNLFGSSEVLAYVTTSDKDSGTKDAFSAPYFRNSCRFSAHGRKKHH